MFSEERETLASLRQKIWIKQLTVEEMVARVKIYYSFYILDYINYLNNISVERQMFDQCKRV